MTILDQYKCLVYVLGTLFLSIFAIGIDTAVSAEVRANDTRPVDSLGTEVGYIYSETVYAVPVEGSIQVNPASKLSSATGDSFTYELSQNDKGVESTDAKDEKNDSADERGAVKQNGPGAASEPIQYCQGRFKRLGGTAVEIITVRCPKVDDSCNCEADKKAATKWIDCGGARKDSTIGSDLLSCESKIVGSGAVSDSE